jgi:hypothetical protein
MKPTENPKDHQNAKRVERLQIMVTDAELEALDNWRFNVRMPSRSAAVRELLRRGLAADGYFDQTNPKNASAGFGVIDDKNGT